MILKHCSQKNKIRIAILIAVLAFLGSVAGIVLGAWVNSTSIMSKDNFPHGKDANLDLTVSLGPGTAEAPYVTGIDGGNLMIMPGKTLELEPYTRFVINPGFQVINNGGHTAIAQNTSSIVNGYLWAKDSDNDKCFIADSVRYNNSPSQPDASWGNGYKRVSELEYYPDPDDSSPGPAPACTASSYNLSITKSGTGNGIITSSPQGIACGSICTAAFSFDTSVVLSVAANPGSTFSGWTGDCTGMGDCRLTMDSAKTVRSSFESSGAVINITKSGNGTGTVVSIPEGIDCGEKCSSTFPLDSDLSLKATPLSGSVFSGWFNDCSGTKTTCSFNVDEDKEIEAKFSLGGTGTYYRLTVVKNGPGMVKTTSIGGVVCGTDCTHQYYKNLKVTLTAYPDSGATFVNWAGDCSGTSTNCTVTMSSVKNVTANFSGNTYSLSISNIGNGQGTIISMPTGINCGMDCNNNYVPGTVITLTATPLSGSTFVGWSGLCTGTGTCAVLMDGNKTIYANFSLSNLYTLNILKTGSGRGVVATTPPGIDCGYDCSEGYFQRTEVILSASAYSDSDFIGWSGAGCTGTGSCNLIIDASKTVTAVFTTKNSNRYTLVVNKTGNGKVTSVPIGIDCGSVCSFDFNYDTTVMLVAEPSQGATFTGWSGACTGSNLVCTVAMNQLRTVNAVFTTSTPTIQTLSVSKLGTGQGTIVSSPSGINCGSDCTENFNQGTSVTLTASASSGSSFASWAGDCSGSSNTCVVSMNAAKQVIGIFNASVPSGYTLTVSKTGTGSGTVTSVPAGITCGTDGTDCTENYSSGTTVLLIAAAPSSSTFTGWSGACTGTSITCNVLMNSAKSVTANFNTSTTSKTLTVVKAGSGSGTVTSSPSGINCGSSCTGSFNNGATVTLSASALSGSTFAGWSGAGCSGTGNCVITVSANTSVTATFNGGSAKYTLSVTLNGTGTGQVSDMAGIYWLDCRTGYTDRCSYDYTAGSQITLGAGAYSGSTFVNWGGVCSGTATTCVVTMNSNKAVTATFNTGGGGGGTGTIKLPVCSFSASVGIYGVPSGWYGSNINCNLNAACSKSYLSSEFETAVGGFAKLYTWNGLWRAASPINACVVDAAASYTNTNSLPTCSFSGSAGDVYVSPKQCSGWSSKCKIGSACDSSTCPSDTTPSYSGPYIAHTEGTGGFYCKNLHELQPADWCKLCVIRQ